MHYLYPLEAYHEEHRKAWLAWQKTREAVAVEVLARHGLVCPADEPMVAFLAREYGEGRFERELRWAWIESLAGRVRLEYWPEKSSGLRIVRLRLDGAVIAEWEEEVGCSGRELNRAVPGV